MLDDKRRTRFFERLALAQRMKTAKQLKSDKELIEEHIAKHGVNRADRGTNSKKQP